MDRVTKSHVSRLVEDDGYKALIASLKEDAISAMLATRDEDKLKEYWLDWHAADRLDVKAHIWAAEAKKEADDER